MFINQHKYFHAFANYPKKTELNSSTHASEYDTFR